MGLTLNGIAQGYITDRVTDILREHGCRIALSISAAHSLTIRDAGCAVVMIEQQARRRSERGAVPLIQQQCSI